MEIRFLAALASSRRDTGVTLGADFSPSLPSSVLNANWLKKRLNENFPAAHDRVCMHEFVCTAAKLKKDSTIRALDVAKGLLEEGFHSPTVYFPLVVEEALMFEPTETESLQTLEAIATAMDKIAGMSNTEEGREGLKSAP